MTGFWNPIWAFVKSLFNIWAKALLAGFPQKMQHILQVVDEPKRIRVKTLNNLEKEMLSVAVEDEICFELDETLILRHEMLVPVAAIGDARNVVRLEAERIMPLAASRLSICHKVADVFNRDLIPVEVVATRQVTIMALLDLSKKLGRNIHSITTSTDDKKPSIAFSVSNIMRRKLLRGALLVCSVLFILVTLSAVPQLYQSRLLGEIKKIDLRIQETRRQTDTIAGLQRQVRALKGISDAVQEEKDAANIIELLVLLTKASPDDIVLDIFRIDGQRVFVSGVADAPENWVIELEQNSAFENVVLSSVRGGEDSLSKRFEIRFDILWRTYREEI